MLYALLFACAPDPGTPAEPLAPPDAELAPPDEGGDPDRGGVPRSDTASLYALDVPLLTHGGAAAGLDVMRGHPTLFSMFYTTCPMACPLLIQDIQGLEAGLTPEEREGLRVVLVSLDPAWDDAAAMRGVVEKHALDARWTLGAVPIDVVPEVAAALGVRYRPLAGGGFAHTAVLTLVDGEGRIAARSEGAEGREALIAAIRQMARAPRATLPR